MSRSDLGMLTDIILGEPDKKYEEEINMSSLYNAVNGERYHAQTQIDKYRKLLRRAEKNGNTQAVAVYQQLISITKKHVNNLDSILTC